MDNLFNDVEKSLNDKNFYAALFISLSLPYICLSIQKGKSTGLDYIKWVDDNMPQEYKGKISGKDCFAFRCSVLHEGTDNIAGQSKKDIIDKFEILSRPESSHLISYSGNIYDGIPQPTKIFINLNTFCRDLVNSSKKFLQSNNLQSEELIKIKEEYSDGYITVV